MIVFASLCSEISNLPNPIFHLVFLVLDFSEVVSHESLSNRANLAL